MYEPAAWCQTDFYYESGVKFDVKLVFSPELTFRLVTEVQVRLTALIKLLLFNSIVVA